MSSELEPHVAPVRDRFGYLLKHARERLSVLSAEALAPIGVNGRELAILTALAEGGPPSQLEAAQRLAIDRTTMVGLLDALEAKGFVERKAHERDRRRNVVVLTPAGHRTLLEGARATDVAEAAFLAALPARDRDRLRRMLQQIVESESRA